MQRDFVDPLDPNRPARAKRFFLDACPDKYQGCILRLVPGPQAAWFTFDQHLRSPELKTNFTEAHIVRRNIDVPAGLECLPSSRREYMMKIRAAIAYASDRPFELCECDLAEPGAGEVLVRIKACGICHTDLAVKHQHMPVPLPMVLGHEGAGIIERVGKDVSDLKAGDHVVMSFGSCGTCRNCQNDRPGYCESFLPINLFGKRDGHEQIHRDGIGIAGGFFSQSSFATYALATTRNVVKIDSALPLELLAPLGCGIQTGMGTVMLSLAPSPGSSIAVFGAGSVGLAGVMAAKISGCAQIIAVDIRPDRLALARELGATHVIDGGKKDADAQILEITGKGADCAFDTTGLPSVVQQAFNCLASRGQVALVAVPPMGTQYTFDAHALLSSGRSVRGVVEGDAIPKDFIPRMVEFYQRGLMPLEKIIKLYPFNMINKAIADSESGESIKAVLLMDK